MDKSRAFVEPSWFYFRLKQISKTLLYSTNYEFSMDLCAGALLEDKTINKFPKSYSVVNLRKFIVPHQNLFLPSHQKYRIPCHWLNFPSLCCHYLSTLSYKCSWKVNFCPTYRRNKTWIMPLPAISQMKILFHATAIYLPSLRTWSSYLCLKTIICSHFRCPTLLASLVFPFFNSMAIKH